MPSTPISSTLTPVLDWLGEPAVPPPKASVARSTPMAIVSTSRPSGLKPMSAMPIVGFCSTSGPSVIGLVAATAPGAVGESVKVERRPARLVTLVVVLKPLMPSKNSTLTVPAWNRLVRFLAFLSLR